MPRTRRPLLRLERLEARAVPAVAVWDGGGADNKWTTAANWQGDVAPQAGDLLVFPAAAAQLTNVNDFPAGTSFGSLALNGGGYTISGNAITLTGGITVTPDGTSNTLGLAIAGAGGLTKVGTGTLILTGANTFTGQTAIQAGTVSFNGTQTGPVNAQGGAVAGSGTVGALTVGNGATIDPGDLSAFNAVGTLTSGDLALQAGGTSPAGILSVFVTAATGGLSADKVVVRGAVRLGGQLTINTISRPAPQVLTGAATIIDNDGADAVQGTFAGLPEGATVTDVNRHTFRVSYKGGDGNDVTITAVDTASVPRFAAAAGAGGGPQVNVYAYVYPDQAPILLRAFNAYDPSFRGGVRVATADFTGDGILDIVTAPGTGGGPVVRLWNGATGAMIREFNAYDPAFRGGAFVAAADVNGDGTPDIITGAGETGGPHVKVFSGTDNAVLASFFAYDASFTGGVRVAGADTTGDGKAEVVTGAGPGGGPHVQVFDLAHGVTTLSFFPYNDNFRGGVTVATGDIDGDGVPDIITGEGAGGPPRVRGFAGRTGAALVDFPAYNQAFQGGVTVAAAELTGDNRAEIITGPGAGGGPNVFAFDARLGAVVGFYAFDPAFTGGVFVG